MAEGNLSAAKTALFFCAAANGRRRSAFGFSPDYPIATDPFDHAAGGHARVTYLDRRASLGLGSLEI
jgi:hypothetical protein